MSYLKIVAGDYQLQVSNRDDVPVSINYSLEDPENFQNKKSSESFDVEVPATLLNSVAANTYQNPSIEDLTSGKLFRNNQFGLIEANGYELLTGKSFLKTAKHTNKPISFTWNFLGDNADWLVLLKDKTLYDFVKAITFTFDKAMMEASWAFDGTDEALPYVFAPVRYRRPFGDYVVDINGVTQPDDDNVLPEYLRPSISKYWILYWAFKSIGYRIQSNFMDLEYFRRQVMPWTWGNFLDSGGTQLDKHKFLAKSTEDQYFTVERGQNGKLDDYIDVKATNDSTSGAFDNNDDYSYDLTTFELKWQYKVPDYGPLIAGFSMIIYYVAAISGNSSDMNLSAEWYINGTPIKADTIVKSDSNMNIGTQRPQGQTEIFFKTPVIILNDVVSVKIHLRLYRDKTALNDVNHIIVNVLQFQLDYFRIPLGGTIDFSNFDGGFQKRKFIDYFAGIIDEFNLSINTDSINKIVYIEPTHEYSTNNDVTDVNEGYFKDDFLDWSTKADLLKEWQIDNYAETEKELIFKYRDDTNDGILKLIQDRNINKLAIGKYVFPERFQTGSKDHENRFFSPTMHYGVEQWKSIGTGSNTSIPPQLVCIVPENISQTSQSESENTFEPKSCYYKGNITGAGAWRWDDVVLQTLPFMFAVNYQSGGENDPILSYSDENISGVIGKGLLKRFFWQRLAIMRNGQFYSQAWFRLNNSDVASQIHREYKSLNGNKWELVQIKNYKPLSDESTACFLRRWYPVTQDDLNNTYPTIDCVLTGDISGGIDLKYAQLKCLISDIPR